jgi:transcription elongation factor S-II
VTNKSKSKSNANANTSININTNTSTRMKNTLNKSNNKELNNMNNKEFYNNNKNSIPNISAFNIKNEYMKMFNFRTLASNNIRTDVMHFAINNLKRKEALMSLLKYISIEFAIEIEKGILEYTLIQISNEKSDLIEIMINIYNCKINDICINLDVNNLRINNKTLAPSINDKLMNPYWLAFMLPHQLHPARWAKELEKQRVIEEAYNTKKVTDIYKCRKCGDRKSSTTQMQTRSADEPITTFVTCLTCYNTFTI